MNQLINLLRAFVILPKPANFTLADDAIADQILASCSSTQLKERILREDKVDLAFILKQGRILECSKQQASQITAKSKSAEINTLRTTRNNAPPNHESRTKSEGKCRNCGQSWPHEPSKPCPALGKTCHACGKHNHFSSVVVVASPLVYNVAHNAREDANSSTKSTKTFYQMSYRKMTKDMSTLQRPKNAKTTPHLQANVKVSMLFLDHDFRLQLAG